MASNPKFVDYVLNQIQRPGEATAKKMFGEYGIYLAGKMFGVICNDQLFIKPTAAGAEFIGEVVEASPYAGAKSSFLIEDRLEDSEWLTQLVKITADALPDPKPKKKK